MKTTGVIVLDGPDHSGKTTLAKKLLELNGGGHYLHLTYRWPKKMHLYHLAAIDWALRRANRELVVIDRWWLSEEIYAHVYRHGTNWPTMGRQLQRLLLKAAGLFILCLPNDKEWVLAGHSKRRELEMYDTIEAVYDCYREVFLGNKDSKLEGYGGQLARSGGTFGRFGWRIYDPLHHQRPNELINFVDHTLLNVKYQRRYQHPFILNSDNFIGNFDTATHVMVGEELKPKFNRHVYPFIDESNSSQYLAQCCGEVLLPEERFIWTNAYVKDKPSLELCRLLKTNPQLVTVALGKKAAKMLQQHGVRTDVLFQHPQWCRRFDHHGTIMVDNLRSLIDESSRRVILKQRNLFSGHLQQTTHQL